ncbi:hypothetical protein [Paenibacillus sp. GCM10027629]
MGSNKSLGWADFTLGDLRYTGAAGVISGKHVVAYYSRWHW